MSDIKNILKFYTDTTKDAIDEIKSQREQDETALSQNEKLQNEILSNPTLTTKGIKEGLGDRYFKNTTPKQPLLNALDKDTSSFLLNKQRYGDISENMPIKNIDRNDVNEVLAKKFVKEADPSLYNNIKHNPDIKSEKLMRMLRLSTDYLPDSKLESVTLNNGLTDMNDKPLYGHMDKNNNMNLDINAPLNVPFHELLHSVYPETANENFDNMINTKDPISAFKKQQAGHINNAEQIKKDTGEDVGSIGESYELIKALLKAKNKK